VLRGSESDPYGIGGGHDGELTREDLLARPALEDVVATYDAMIAEMQTALSEDFAGTWTASDPAGGGPSGDTADGVEASYTSSPIWLLDHSVAGSAQDAMGATLRFGSVEATTLTDTTCTHYMYMRAEMTSTEGKS